MKEELLCKERIKEEYQARKEHYVGDMAKLTLFILYKNPR